MQTPLFMGEIHNSHAYSPFETVCEALDTYKQDLLQRGPTSNIHLLILLWHGQPTTYVNMLTLIACLLIRCVGKIPACYLNQICPPKYSLCEQSYQMSLKMCKE